VSEAKKSRAEYQREWRAKRGARTGQPGRPVTEPCGTVSAYKRHQRRGEPVCDPCRTAWNDYTRELRRTKTGKVQ
jgi:hypothetical protein